MKITIHEIIEFLKLEELKFFQLHNHLKFYTIEKCIGNILTVKGKSKTQTSYYYRKVYLEEIVILFNESGIEFNRTEFNKKCIKTSKYPCSYTVTIRLFEMMKCGEIKKEGRKYKFKKKLKWI